MVVGNGLIASAFKQYEDDNSVIVFASGVSNSKTQDNKEYDREISLINTFLHTKEKFVYFSTCSIFDESLKDSRYISHKIKTEQYIKENFENYLIFRLPNVVGNTGNLHTSFNFFKNKITNSEPIDIQSDAVRYFIDIDDLQKTLPPIISNNIESNKVINVSFDNKIKIAHLILLFEFVLKKLATKKIVAGGNNYSIDNSYFMDIIKKNNFKISNMYNIDLVKKYLKHE